jgi:hypothetical protein
MVLWARIEQNLVLGKSIVFLLGGTNVHSCVEAVDKFKRWAG